jgi:S-formylglutathione hydrolase FrmB
VALIHCDFYSEALRLCTSVCVVLPQPPGPLDWTSAPPARKYPVLWLLHGLSDDHTIWQRRTSIERYVNSTDLAVVMPAVHRSWYTDMAAGNRYWTFISEELPGIMRSLFPLSPRREDNFVAGLSMGGYGAFKLALRHPERYAAAASLSGALGIAYGLAQTPDEAMKAEMKYVFGDLAIVPGSENDTVALAERYSRSTGPQLRLYQCCGTEDFLYDSNVRFRDYARKLGLDLTYEEGPGEHDWGYWDCMIQRVLTWLPLEK